MKMLKSITTDTMVPISVLAFLCGGIYWLSNLALRTEANAQALEQVSIEQRKLVEIKTDVEVIKSKISNIESKVDNIERAVVRRH